MSLTTAGDTLQSSAARLAEYVLSLDRDDHNGQRIDVPYEVRMAALEANTAVQAWTNARLDSGSGWASLTPEGDSPDHPLQDAGNV